MSNLTVNHTFETDNGSKVHIAEHYGQETWVTTDLVGDGEPTTVVIPWAEWEKFRHPATPAKTKNVIKTKATPKKKAKK